MLENARAAIMAAVLACALIAPAALVAPRHAAAANIKKVGKASYYGRAHHGRRTASGERFDMGALTAAHPTLPFGTKVKVTNRKNGRSVVVRINDRGPFHNGRVIDLSRAAAAEIGMLKSGAASITLDVR